jgi:hypothetical protein
MSDSRTEQACIGWTVRLDDGSSFGFDNAKVKCPECDGWTGTTCPHGCGVRLISTQAEDDIAFRERMREEEAERRRYRAERKAAREAEEQR